jgi:hypothetical protein
MGNDGNQDQNWDDELYRDPSPPTTLPRYPNQGDPPPAATPHSMATEPSFHGADIGHLDTPRLQMLDVLSPGAITPQTGNLWALPEFSSDMHPYGGPTTGRSPSYEPLSATAFAADSIEMDFSSWAHHNPNLPTPIPYPDSPLPEIAATAQQGAATLQTGSGDLNIQSPREPLPSTRPGPSRGSPAI